MADVSVSDPLIRRPLLRRLTRPFRIRYSESRWETVGRFIPAALYLLAIYTVSSVQGSELKPLVDDRVAHFIEYAGLAVCLLLGAAGLSRSGLSGAAYVIVWIFSAAYAITDEWHQSFVPGRDAAVSDVIFDGLGSAAALIVMFLLVRRAEAA